MFLFMLTLTFHANFAKFNNQGPKLKIRHEQFAFLLSYNYTLVYLGVYLPGLDQGSSCLPSQAISNSTQSFNLHTNLLTYHGSHPPLLAYLDYLPSSYKIHVRCSIHVVYIESHLSLIVNIILMDFVEKILIFQSCEQNEATILAHW